MRGEGQSEDRRGGEGGKERGAESGEKYLLLVPEDKRTVKRGRKEGTKGGKR